MAGEIIRKGDSTSHGGTVLEGSMTDICHGKPIAYVGHKVHCPKCKGDFPIVEGVLTTTFYGKGVAIAGMKTSCGATLVPTQFTDIVEYGGGSQGAAAGVAGGTQAAPAARFGSAAAAAGGGADPTAAGTAAEKRVTRIFWTYGASETPVEDVSRHYVDLNVHFETENYAAGERIDVTFENDDGRDIVEGARSIALQAVVLADGSASIKDVFKGKNVEIGVLG